MTKLRKSILFIKYNEIRLGIDDCVVGCSKYCVELSQEMIKIFFT